MWVWLDRIGLILFDATVSTAIFLSLVVLAMLVCRQPSRRVRIARVALISSLAMIPMVGLAPLPRIDIADTIIRSDLVPARLIFSPDLPVPASPSASSRGNAAAWLLSGDFSARSRGVGKWLERGLILIDLTGVGMGLGWLVLGCWGVRWLIRHSHEPSARTRLIFDRLLNEGGSARRRVAVRLSTRIKRPVVVGLLRSTILIPRSFEELNDDGDLLRLTMLHEIAHAEQSDPWFGTAASLAQTFWFFLPQIWWIRSQLLIDQEFLADRLAAIDYGTTSGYAASLLKLAGSQTADSATEPHDLGSKPGWHAGQDHAGRSPLFQRMLMLLHCPFRFESRAPRSWSWTLRLAVIAASVMAACLCLRWPNASAIEVWQKGKSAAPGRQTFRVKLLVAKPTAAPNDRRSIAYRFPLVLPPHFELTVDVLSDSAELAHVRLAGHSLGHPPLSACVPDRQGNISGDLETWHQVRLVRDDHLLSLWVDGQIVPVDSQPEKTDERLTVEPGPLRPVTFRNLVVTW